MQRFFTSTAVITLFLFSFFNVNSQTKNDPFSELDKTKISTGLLYNKVKIPVSQIKNYNGTSKIQILNPVKWRDIYSELYYSSLIKNIRDYQSVKQETKSKIRQNIFPVGIINYSYNEFKENAVKSGLVTIKNNKYFAEKGNIYDTHHVFATSVIISKQYTGLTPVFDFSKEYYYSNSENKITYLDIDFDNGNSFRKVYLNEKVKIKYTEEGDKIIHIKANFENGTSYVSKFKIKISSPKMPAPSETWSNYTANESYLGVFAQGEVGVFFGSGNTDFTRPVIIVDGFDPGDTRDIAGLWDIANQQNMADNLIAEGYDFIIVNFFGGDDYIQRNALLVKKVIQEINTRMTAAGTMKDANQIVVIGPSMGGLITRYAIRNMEQNGQNHNVRNWVAFDSPMKGASIPLGLQHWVRFFADEGDVQGAIDAKVALSGPAAKQMLIYHYTATVGNTANSNGLYSTFYNELNAMGFPEQTRIVAIANGSGYSANQGFGPGDQVVKYSYASFLVDIEGNIWAVPNQSYQRIFQGALNKIWPLPDSYEDIYVNNTLPYDGAPGGKRNTFLELDQTDTGGYGDIIAFHNSHSFIPVISSMCIQNTVDPYFNINNNINTLTTPFDKLYYPNENQDHVQITPESYAWFYHEVINFAPVFTSAPVTSVNEDEVYTYTLSATDENEWNVLTYEFIEKPAWLNFNASTGEFSGTPLNEDVGIFNVSVKVKDELDETIQAFTITVVNTNDAPVITSTAVESATEDIQYTYTFTATDEDPVPDILTLSAVEIPAWLSFDEATGILSGTPLNEDVGTYNVILRVNDGTVDIDQTFTITVANTNDAPIMQSELSDQETYTNELFNYSFAENVFSDIDAGDILSYSANLTNGNPLPEWLSFNSDTRTFSGTPSNIESFEVSVTATDLKGASISDKFILDINGHISMSESILIYPNPASHFFYIENRETINKIEIINIEGKEIRNIQPGNNKIHEIDVSDISGGIYFLKISNLNKSFLRKLIIE
ncbi:MAG: putative Ig domain-containing protein [Bacteroidales bacterium]|nr:putative Ig domain-containing protein [Bacteroidales bacterium]